MTLANSDLPRAPLDKGTADQQYNRLVDRVSSMQQYLGDNLRGPEGEARRAAAPDMFLGYITSNPPGASPGTVTQYTDARYYVVRCVAPDPKGGKPTYDKQGSLTDNLSVNNDPFNGRMALPTYVTATNLAELTGAMTDTSGSPGTHSLPPNTIVFVVGFSSRANPLKRTYVFHQGGSLPVGQYEFQVFQMVSQNQSGFDFVRAHPLIG